MLTPRKLRLDLQDLQVESFDPTARAAGRGTVVGHNLTQQVGCYTFQEGCPYSQTLNCSACGCGAPSGPGTCDANGCPVEDTQEVTCLNATCYWAGGAPFYAGNC